MSATVLHRLAVGVYVSGRFSVERAPRGAWSVYDHGADARAACASGGRAPDCLGSGLSFAEARSLVAQRGSTR